MTRAQRGEAVTMGQPGSAVTAGQPGSAVTVGQHGYAVRQREQAVTARRSGHGVVTWRARRARRPPDRGAASLWVVAAGLVLVAAAVAGAAIGAATVARHEARTAADLGALAGAARTPDPAAACARAAEFVTANGGRLTACTADGLDLVVVAEVPVTPLAGLRRVATATARAGPMRQAG
jgi:secretion/DNA translocation related TadE-like protein